MSGEESAPLPDAPPTTLRNGNPRRDLATLPRCGARTRAGTPCRQPAMRNGRCRLHGGRSTGARTAGGKAAQIAAHTKTGERGARGRALQEVVDRLRLLSRLFAQGLQPPKRCRSHAAWLDAQVGQQLRQRRRRRVRRPDTARHTRAAEKNATGPDGCRRPSARAEAPAAPVRRVAGDPGSTRWGIRVLRAAQAANPATTPPVGTRFDGLASRIVQLETTAAEANNPP